MSVIVTMVLLLAIQAAAVDTTAPDAADIMITNNLTGTPDTVEIGNVAATDVIKVYKTLSGGVPIGATAADGANATLYIDQLGKLAGSLFVSVTAVGFEESDRTQVDFVAETQSTALAADDVTIVNNIFGTLDEITIINIAPDDIIRVYPNSVSSFALGTVISDDITATLFINQLSTAAGRVYITVQHTDELESGRTAVAYASETSDTLTTGLVTVANNFYTAPLGSQPPESFDTITVSGVDIGDSITVYTTLTGSNILIGTGPLVAGDISGTDTTITISQLGIKAGKIYVTIKKVGKAESKRATVYYPAEIVSVIPADAIIKVTNNYDAIDYVDVSGLTDGDIVSVYNSPVSLLPIGSDTVGPGATTASASIAKDVLLAAGGKVYVTVTSVGANESSRKIVTYLKEDANKALSSGQITIVNNYNTSDTVLVSGLAVGDVIKIYTTLTSPLWIESDTAATDTLLFTLSSQLPSAKGGNIYVTITTSAAGESPRASVRYSAEPVTSPPVAKDINVVNNYRASDTVFVPGIQEYDEVRVYTSMTGGTEIGLVSVNAGETSATVLIADDADKKLSATGGKIYVSVKSTVANESARVLVLYSAEATALAPDVNDIVVTNNFNIEDTILVSGLGTDYVVTVYSALTGTTVIDSGTVGDGETTIEFTLPAGKLSSAGGKIYVSVKYPLSNEGPRRMVIYASEKTPTPDAKTVTIVNNYYIEGDITSYDLVSIPGVVVGDKINIYKASGGISTWVDTVTITTDGTADIVIDQLGSKSGKIYITLTKEDKVESARIGVPFLSEPVTSALPASKIIVTNNYTMEDVVTVIGLVEDQIITVYTSTTGSTILANETVKTGETEITFTLEDGVLAAGGGKIFVAVKNPTELESIRTAQIYTPETTTAPKASNILVVNYPGSAYDTITLVGLTSGDIVTVYDAATGGTEITRATVAEKGVTLTLTTNLPDSGGTIYVSVTNDNKAESKRTAVTYYAS